MFKNIFLAIYLIVGLAGTALADSRADYAATLERELLARGFDVRVSAQPGEKLLLLGPVDRPLLAALLNKASLIETAKDRGFNQIEFIGRDRWLFDLSRSDKCSVEGAVICRE